MKLQAIKLMLLILIACFTDYRVIAQSQSSLFGPINPQEISPILGRMQKAQSCTPETLLRVVPSPYSVKETVDRITKILNEKKMPIYSMTDYQNINQKNSILPPQVMIMFGKPGTNVKTPVQKPVIGIQYPLRIMVWQSSQNKTYVGYIQSSGLAKCYPLNTQTPEQQQELDQLLHSIVTKALASPSAPPTESKPNPSNVK